ncbi:MAG TPA: TonB-dependent receptor, partial [Parvularculaceae bacterium]|nr:TonB-dependent receptor [Parvularculaceae bacterium]
TPAGIATQPLAAQQAAGQAAAAAAAQGYSLYTPFFYNDADDTFLHSTSIFGEVYFNLTSNLKLTGGVRHNWDTKGTRQRGNLLESASPTNPAILTDPAHFPPVVPIGTPSVRPLLDTNELVQCQPLGSFCPTGGVNDFQVVRGNFDATTGRAVLQWTPSEDLQIYASWTRGFKPGGFNPRTLFANVPLTYRPEIIKAYEAGIKSRPSRTMQLNLTGFYYDYTDLQVSRIVANTSVNDNINAKIYGIEGEWVWQPVEDLTFNANASYLHTKIGDFSAIDVRNPTAGLSAFGADGVVLLADLTNGSNCVVQLNGGPNIINPAVTLASLNAALAAGAPALAAGFDALTSGPFTICSSLQSLLNTPQIPTGLGLISLNQALGTNFQVIDGIETSAKGNELPGSPKFNIAGGVQFNIHMGPHFLITPRVDAYYQSRMFTNIFNTLQDRVNGYGYLNAQVRFHPSDANWYIRAFVQNLTDNNAVTGAFDVGQGAGNFQNIFILEPRRYGIGAGFSF